MKDLPMLHFCQEMPKVELHAHLNTSFDEKTLQKLVDRKSTDNAEVLNWSMSISENKEIDESFNIFKLIHTIVDDEEAVYMLTVGVVRRFAAENVKYLELRSTPKEIPQTGMTRELYVQTMLRAVCDCQKENLDITVYLLLSIDRRNGVQVAQLTVDLAERFFKETEGVVIGVDFSGDPAVGNAAEFIPVFLSAKQKGLKVASHLAELPKFEETLSVLRVAPPDRIGHGTFLHQGLKEIENIVISQKIPIEACMTSNLKCKTVTEYSEHHFKFWFQKNHPVVICTDGPGVYITSLSVEYAHAACTFNFSKQDLWKLSVASIEYIFAPESVKQMLRQKWDAACPKDM